VQMEDKFAGLTLEELEAQKVELLPLREEMDLVTGPATAFNISKTTQVGVAINVGGGNAGVWQAAQTNQFAAANSGFVY
jgi:hypothetical protein